MVEPAESLDPESSTVALAEASRLRSKAWQVHAGVLAVYAVIGLIALVDSGGEGIIVAFIAAPLLVYAVFTSLVMLFVGRRPLAAVLIHLGVIVVWAGCAAIFMAQRNADIGEAAR